MNQPDRLADLRAYVEEQLAQGADPEQVRLAVLGRKGRLTEVLRGLSGLSLEERVTFGKQANDLKRELDQRLTDAKLARQPQEVALPDRTVPPYQVEYGNVHPVSAMIERMVGIFEELSFEVVEGNELVTERENFESLNMDKDHPARDNHKSFLLEDGHLLRTQTTAVQVAEMARRFKAGQMPIRVVIPGKTYRHESDPTHSAMFHQIDAIMVDTQTAFTDLKGILEYVVRRLFGDSVETRFRPHFFPFTEPSAEIDIRWKQATSGGGRHTEWLEMLGCGMIHPNVLKRAGINPRIYQGWAFGTSIERPVMVSEQIPDIRRLFDGSIHFLNQFSDRL